MPGNSQAKSGKVPVSDLRLIEIIQDVAGVYKKIEPRHSLLGDLDMDSLELSDFMSRLEDRLAELSGLAPGDVFIPPMITDRWETVGDVLAYLRPYVYEHRIQLD